MVVGVDSLWLWGWGSNDEGFPALLGTQKTHQLGHVRHLGAAKEKE